MIAVEGVVKSFGKKHVLNGLNMQVCPGEVYGFLGENGAGKSTTMNIITGLLSADAGSIRINGKEISQMEAHPIGYLPESPEFFPYMTCREYFRYIAAACSFRENPEKRTEEIIGLIGLQDAIDRKIKGFSRGMKQRIGIGCALYSGKDILILDEPTSALDPQGRADVMRIIEQLKEMGKTVILSTHILSDVERVADRVGILHDGKIQMEGRISDLLDEHSEKRVEFQAEWLPEDFQEKLMQQEFTGACKISQQGGWVEINGDFSAGNQKLFQFLAQNQCRIRQYQVVRPTLEQIYLKVVGSHGTTTQGWRS